MNNNNNIEIERKYLVNRDLLELSNLIVFDTKEIKQGYWNKENHKEVFDLTIECLKDEGVSEKEVRNLYLLGSNKIEMRIRKSNDKYLVTFKGNEKKKGGVLEFEYEISEKLGEELYSQTDYRLEKTRYCVNLENLVMEIDCFKNFDLILMEIELNDIDEIIPKLPNWVIREVTNEKEYTNRSLSERYSNQTNQMNKIKVKI